MLKNQHFRGFSLWQRRKDSNPHKRSQSPVCYLYTTPLNASVIIYIFFFLSTPFFIFILFLFQTNSACLIYCTFSARLLYIIYIYYTLSKVNYYALVTKKTIGAIYRYAFIRYNIHILTTNFFWRYCPC